MLRILSLMVLGLLWAGPVHAQPAAPTEDAPRPEGVPEEVGIEERLGETIPLDLTFVNAAGEQVTLQQYFDGERPVILNFVYHDCPMLCSLILDGLTQGLQAMEWTPGEQFDVLTVSFAAEETHELAAQQKALYLEKLGKPEAAAGWHFLTGEEADIRALAEATGFGFQYEEAVQEYAHNAALILLSGDGMVARYLYGISYQAFDLKAGLLEASEGKISASLGDRLLMFCFQYDPASQSYTPHVMNLMKLGALTTILLLGTMLYFMWRRERRRQLATAAPTTA